jgi:hypothetical protein
MNTSLYFILGIVCGIAVECMDDVLHDTEVQEYLDLHIG